jgi:hypothetical protein
VLAAASTAMMAVAALAAGPTAHADPPYATLETTTGEVQVLGRALWCMTGYGLDAPVFISGCKSGNQVQQWKLTRINVPTGKSKGIWLIAQWVRDPSLCISEGSSVGSHLTLVQCLTENTGGGVARMTEIRGVENAWQIISGKVKLAVPAAMNADPSGKITSYMVTWQNSTRYRYGWLLPSEWHEL